MGLLPLTYTRPKHMPKESISEASMVSDSESGNNITNSDGSVKSGKSGSSNGIPESLTFDRIINGGTCPVSLAPRPKSALLLTGSAAHDSP